MSDNTALLAGFTKPILAFSQNGEYELNLWVHPDADLEDRFKAYDRDECEFIIVNGWLFDIEGADQATGDGEV